MTMQTNNPIIETSWEPDSHFYTIRLRQYEEENEYTRGMYLRDPYLENPKIIKFLEILETIKNTKTKPRKNTTVFWINQTHANMIRTFLASPDIEKQTTMFLEKSLKTQGKTRKEKIQNYLLLNEFSKIL